MLEAVMTYRDDHEAALARIEALEDQLEKERGLRSRAEAQAAKSASAGKDPADLFGQLARAKRELAEVTQKLERLRVAAKGSRSLCQHALTRGYVGISGGQTNRNISFTTVPERNWLGQLKDDHATEFFARADGFLRAEFCPGCNTVAFSKAAE